MRFRSLSRQPKRPRSRCPFVNRVGTATVEVAIALPILILLVFGSIETAEFVHLKQDLSICGYEAAKLASRGSSTTSEVTARFNELMTAKGINGASISVSPSLNDGTKAGTEIAITASVVTDSNFNLPMSFFNGKTLDTTIYVTRQGD
ncbi:TadE/TadG family type IV pilus assembly protein [Rubinisphaera margarita]|uniref:TadE/TadG family type IV pilus assembly protein n=1 Tax=Rubinisphaera margarita TaxID=2909586 RepID=UPI001EE86E53|nr:TadE/TadG family type IV pilus assembly protein [Rubinisphaera margarita]MCG6158409.1 pilus assembly protein [Rubinisphaera margarita]